MYIKDSKWTGTNRFVLSLNLRSAIPNPLPTKAVLPSNWAQFAEHSFAIAEFVTISPESGCLLTEHASFE